MQKAPMTVDGHRRLREELDDLKKVQRPRIVQEIEEARAHGDLKENAEYHAAKDKQGFVEGRIREIEGKLAIAQVIDISELSGDRVLFGAFVTVFFVDTDEEKTYTFSRTSPLPGVPTDFRVAPLDGLSRTFAGDNIDWRLAVDYEVAPDIRFYGQVATGFKGGGVNPRPYYETQAVPYEQEKATSYELGLKSTWLERRLRLNLAYYHTDYSDYQGQVSLCHDITPEPLWNTPADLCTATRNVGDAKIDGFEVELDARPIPGLSIDGAFSYTDFRFTNGIEGSNIVPGVTQAAFVPEWKYALGAQYEIWLGDAGTLTPRLDWTWQSEMQSTIPNNAPGYELGEIESRGLLNARITYRTADEDWEFALAATNLTDQFYYNNKYDRSNQVGGNAYGMPGRPREFMASIKRNF